MKDLMRILGIKYKAKIVGKIKDLDAYLVISDRNVAGLGLPIRHYELEDGRKSTGDLNEIIVPGPMLRSNKWKIL